MRTHRRFSTGAFVAAGLTLAAYAWIGLAVADDEVLTVESVVRAFAGGRSESQLIQLIRESDVDFDLSRDMLDELRAAGLPEAVLKAMRRRQASVDATKRSDAVGVGGVTGGDGTFTVLLNPKSEGEVESEDDDGPPALRFLDWVPERLAKTLSLPADGRRFTDAAIVLACTQTRHVPDQWRSKTPLGRDFVNTPRHRLLAWVSGARAMDQSKLSKFMGQFVAGPELKDAAILELDIPEQLEGTPYADETDTHDLILGLALQAGGRFYLITAETWEGVNIGPGAGLSATLQGGGNPLAPQANIHFHRDPE